MSAKRCLACGTTEGITKDHVVPRFILRTVLPREKYEEFCSTAARSLNKQPLCADCNQRKGATAVDYRGEETAKQLQEILESLGAEVEIEVVLEQEF